MKKRIEKTDALDLPAQPRPAHTIDEREVRPADETETNLLLAVGKKMEPLGLQYLASGAFHIYHHPLDGTKMFILTQTANLIYAPETVAIQATKELARKAMQTFGHKPPRRRDEAQEKPA